MSIGDHFNTVNKFDQYTANGTSTSDDTKQQEQRQAVSYSRYYTSNSLENEAIRRQRLKIVKQLWVLLYGVLENENLIWEQTFSLLELWKFLGITYALVWLWIRETPGGTPLYKLYRYVPSHRVGFSKWVRKNRNMRIQNGLKNFLFAP